MEKVTTKEQLWENAATFDQGLESNNKFYKDLLRRGFCFIAIKMGKSLRFYPSRFMGYVGNNEELHRKGKKDHEVDGRETSPTISRLLNRHLVMPDEECYDELEREYQKYCASYGVTPQSRTHKYWPVDN